MQSHGLLQALAHAPMTVLVPQASWHNPLIDPPPSDGDGGPRPSCTAAVCKRVLLPGPHSAAAFMGEILP